MMHTDHQNHNNLHQQPMFFIFILVNLQLKAFSQKVGFDVVEAENNHNNVKQEKRDYINNIEDILIGIESDIEKGEKLKGEKEKNLKKAHTELDRITNTDLERRVPVPDSGDELTLLGESMNATIDRHGAAVSANERFVADAAHELRSPITGVKAALEVERAKQPNSLLDDSVAELDRAARLVDDLLVLARRQSGTTQHTDVDLDDVNAILQVIDGFDGVNADVRRFAGAAINDSRQTAGVSKTFGVPGSGSLTDGDLDGRGFTAHGWVLQLNIAAHAARVLTLDARPTLEQSGYRHVMMNAVNRLAKERGD